MTRHVKHLIECQCILSLFKNKTKPLYHKIPVFSETNEEGECVEKYIMCENCGIIHHVTDICKSEIKWGVEGLKSLVNTEEDIKFNLMAQGKDQVVSILETNKMHVSDWEYAEFLIQNNLEGNIILQKNESDNNIIYNILYISKDGIRIKKEIVQRYL